MAKGHENLRVPTSEQARINGSKGGKASQKAQKKRKALREIAEMIDTLPVSGQTLDVLVSMGIPEEECTFEVASIAALKKRVLKGDPRAIELWLKMRGQMPSDKQEITFANGLKIEPIQICFSDSKG